MKQLQELREIISHERNYVGVKPYSHNIISLTLLQIAREYGHVQANKCIRDFDLEPLGWKEKCEEEGELK